MQVNTDTESDICYIRLRDGQCHHSVEIGGLLQGIAYVDVDASHKVLGVEIVGLADVEGINEP